jgi:hypothetical protein
MSNLFALSFVSLEVKDVAIIKKTLNPQKIPCGGCECKKLMYNFLSNFEKYIFNLVLFFSSLQVCQRELF